MVSFAAELAEWTRTVWASPIRPLGGGSRLMPCPHAGASGTILADVSSGDQAANVALYARVSRHDQRGALDRQSARLSVFAAES